MAILTDGKILEELQEGGLVIENFTPSNLGSNSYDLTINENMVVYTEQILDVKEDNKSTTFTIPEGGFVLQPNTLYLAVVNEFIDSKKYIPILEGKSSLARLGLFVHVTAGFGDVGYNGYFTLEIMCIHPIRIYKDMKIAQIYFNTTEGFCINPYNKKSDAKYNNKVLKPQTSKMYMNFPEYKEKLRNRLADSGISFIPDDLQD